MYMGFNVIVEPRVESEFIVRGKSDKRADIINCEMVRLQMAVGVTK